MIKKNFTRRDLTNKLHQKIGFSKNFSSSIIDNFFESLISELTNSNKIKILGKGENALAVTTPDEVAHPANRRAVIKPSY